SNTATATPTRRTRQFSRLPVCSSVGRFRTPACPEPPADKSALDADDLLQVGDDFDQVGLGGDDRVDVLVGGGDLVDDAGVLAGLDAGGLGDQVVDGIPALRLVAAHPPAC